MFVACTGSGCCEPLPSPIGCFDRFFYLPSTKLDFFHCFWGNYLSLASCTRIRTHARQTNTNAHCHLPHSEFEPTMFTINFSNQYYIINTFPQHFRFFAAISFGRKSEMAYPLDRSNENRRSGQQSIPVKRLANLINLWNWFCHLWLIFLIDCRRFGRWFRSHRLNRILQRFIESIKLPFDESIKLPYFFFCSKFICCISFIHVTV